MKGPQRGRERRARAAEVKSFQGRQETEDLRSKIEKAVPIIAHRRVTPTAGLTPRAAGRILRNTARKRGT